jgi:hypothetical protein
MWRECRHSCKCAHAPLSNTHNPTATDKYASRPSCEPEKWDLCSHGSLDFPGQTAQVCTCTLSRNILALPRETQHETRTVVRMPTALRTAVRMQPALRTGTCCTEARKDWPILLNFWRSFSPGLSGALALRTIPVDDSRRVGPPLHPSSMDQKSRE